MEDYKHRLTVEAVQNAASYVSLADKVAFSRIFAEECIDEIPLTATKVQSDAMLALPQRYKENRAKSETLLGRVLLGFYLKMIDPFEPMTTEQIDEYLGSHIENQLERLKQVPACKEKVFDLMSDYAKFRRIFLSEVRDEVEMRNDTLERLLAGIGVMSSPETITALMAELKKASTQLSQEVKGQKIKQNGGAKKRQPPTKKAEVKDDNAAGESES